MAKHVIENFEVHSGGEVKLIEYESGRRTEHTYHSVPKHLALKLINSKEPPTIGEFEGWLNDHEAEEKKKRENGHSGCVSCWGWWSKDNS